MTFDNGIIRFDLPDDWSIEENEEATIFAFDPTDELVRITVELGGVKSEENALDARLFIERVYADKLAVGDASVCVGSDGRVLVSWDQLLEHRGETFGLSYVQVAKNQAANDLQLARFQLAVPFNKCGTGYAQNLREFIHSAARSAVFRAWTE